MDHIHPRWSEAIEAEGPVRMAWEIEPAGDGVIYIVSGLKTYLETGEPMTPFQTEATAR